MQQTVFIIGLGLIGGSLALGLKRNKDVRIIGYDANGHTLRTAKRISVIDEMATNIEDGTEFADVIVFATPVSETIRLMNELPKWQLKNEVIVTDTGSTKKEIMKTAISLRERGITFIGGHPMAGSHKSGVEAARPILFENAYYLLTPFEDESHERIQVLIDLLQVTKAKLVQVGAEEHDHMTAVVSHFPHLVAASLVHQLSFENEQYPFTKQLAAGGFRDLTRIASANPIVWRDITLQNRKELTTQLQAWTNEMIKLQDLLSFADSSDIEAYFTTAKRIRDDLPINTQGAMFSVFDLYVDVPDYPGVISEITRYLAKDNISITNLRIVETREDVFGILVISFQSTDDRAKAVDCIANNTTFETYIS
ncbi:prephenate dehydrogenase [Psychrobacillus sp. INOP01]|uniref:prephenate dehydrogenase n=1 Tax=Psychrobacillus sp. INOP01 TaxID=2829187 RepID=UPI001BAB4550|nr:prephenate dehydrogenase [Psychrobacillus sp. INOP01]QUG41420.1 prephenate dehydrogenase [Psychrobacillus sp. INOP01]